MDGYRPDRITAQLIAAAYHTGYRRCLIDLGEQKPFLSMRQAQHRYGEGIFQSWVDAGLIEVIKEGPRNSRCRVDRARCDELAAIFNPEVYEIKINKTKKNESIKGNDVHGPQPEGQKTGTDSL